MVKVQDLNMREVDAVHGGECPVIAAVGIGIGVGALFAIIVIAIRG